MNTDKLFYISGSCFLVVAVLSLILHLVLSNEIFLIIGIIGGIVMGEIIFVTILEGIFQAAEEIVSEFLLESSIKEDELD